MQRFELINFLLRIKQFNSYLEIGKRNDNYTFKQVNCEIKKILYKAIKNGTGFRAKVNDHDVFGKTGTARIFKDQKYNEDLHNALFIGMTKIEDKEYLVGLFVKNPKINGDGGGDVAAPIFSEIIETIQKL